MKALFILAAAILSSCAIEKPKYETLRKDGDFEVRRYGTIKAVSAPMEDMEKRNAPFRKLFRYISGGNQGKRKIPMTSPVFMDDGTGRETGSMSFMLPAAVAASGAPAPDGEGLKITEMPGGTFAVLRFKGWDKEARREQAAETLSELISRNSLKAKGESFFALYDPPWVPGLLRRNEVWQRVGP